MIAPLSSVGLQSELPQFLLVATQAVAASQQVVKKSACDALDGISMPEGVLLIVAPRWIVAQAALSPVQSTVAPVKPQSVALHFFAVVHAGTWQHIAFATSRLPVLKK